MIRQKKNSSVALEPALLRQNRDAEINLSATLITDLKHEMRESQSEIWKRNNREAIKELNRVTNEHGLLSDDYRTF